ncbi:hypothetical protein [Gordonibacter sp. An230]|nr:hypothetical protein [Gordonibacter sp. An230]
MNVKTGRSGCAAPPALANLPGRANAHAQHALEEQKGLSWTTLS